MDKFYQWVVQILPRRLIYFSYIRLHAFVTTHEYHNLTPDEVSWSMAVKSWEKSNV